MQDTTSIDLLRGAILRSLVDNKPHTHDSQVKLYKTVLDDLNDKDVNLRFLNETTIPKKTQQELFKEEDSTKMLTPKQIVLENDAQVSKNDSILENDLYKTSGGKESKSNKNDEVTSPNNSDVCFSSETISDEKHCYNVELNLKTQISVKNSLNLASRTAIHGIFEDCSTYSIPFHEMYSANHSPKSCPIDNRESNKTFKKHFSFENLYFPPEPAVMPQYEPNSLSDTFFCRDINGEENVFDEEQEQFPSNSTNISEDETQKQRSNRKISKRKKNTLKDSFVYDCPKCGVNYKVQNKSANGTIYCLHCDLWTPVDPVFMKKEKLVWNTCRLC